MFMVIQYQRRTTNKMVFPKKLSDTEIIINLQMIIAKKMAENIKLKNENEALIEELHPDKGCYSCYHPYWKSGREYSYLYCPKRKLDEPQKKDIIREDCWKRVEPTYKHYEELVKKIKVYEESITLSVEILKCGFEDRSGVTSTTRIERWCDSMKLPMSFNHKKCEYYSKGNCLSL